MHCTLNTFLEISEDKYYMQYDLFAFRMIKKTDMSSHTHNVQEEP
jgi:hypothetical protein